MAVEECSEMLDTELAMAAAAAGTPQAVAYYMVVLFHSNLYIGLRKSRDCLHV